MARQKPAQNDTETVVEVEELTPQEQADLDVEDLLLSEAEQSPTETKWNVRVKRVLEDNTEEFLFGCKITDLPLWERLQIKYPQGGRYRAWVTRNGIVYRKIDYRIAATEIDKPIAAPANGFEALAAAMERQSQVIADTVRMAIERPTPVAPTQKDPLELFAALAGIFVQMQGISKPAPTESPIEYMKLGVELASKANGGGGETSMLDIFKAALEGPLGQALATQATERERAMRVQGGPPPQPNYAVQVPPPAQPQPIPQNNPLGPLMQHVEALIVAAEQRKNPELYAELMLDQLPQTIWEPMIANTQLLDGLCQRIPRMQAQRPWFVSMIDAMRRFVEDADEQEQEAASSAQVT